MMDQVADNPLRNPHLAGHYQVKDQELFWTITNDASRHVDDLFWSVNARGDLSFSDAPGVARNWWFGLPWARVGDSAPAPDDDQAVLDGAYRYEVPEQYLLDHGMAAAHARAESGVHTLTMSHGEFTDAWENGVNEDSCAGRFTIEGSRGRSAGPRVARATKRRLRARWRHHPLVAGRIRYLPMTPSRISS